MYTIIYLLSGYTTHDCWLYPNSIPLRSPRDFEASKDYPIPKHST